MFKGLETRAEFQDTGRKALTAKTLCWGLPCVLQTPLPFVVQGGEVFSRSSRQSDIDH